MTGSVVFTPSRDAKPLAQRQLNRAWVLGIVIYLNVASVGVLRCFFGDDSAGAIILLPLN
jgi:hypothetical protein